jgi:hypothetical protein
MQSYKYFYCPTIKNDVWGDCILMDFARRKYCRIRNLTQGTSFHHSIRAGAEELTLPSSPVVNLGPGQLWMLHRGI